MQRVFTKEEISGYWKSPDEKKLKNKALSIFKIVYVNSPHWIEIVLLENLLKFTQLPKYQRIPRRQKGAIHTEMDRIAFRLLKGINKPLSLDKNYGKFWDEYYLINSEEYKISNNKSLNMIEESKRNLESYGITLDDYGNVITKETETLNEAIFVDVSVMNIYISKAKVKPFNPENMDIDDIRNSAISLYNSNPNNEQVRGICEQTLKSVEKYWESFSIAIALENPLPPKLTAQRIVKEAAKKLNKVFKIIQESSVQDSSDMIQQALSLVWKPESVSKTDLKKALGIAVSLSVPNTETALKNWDEKAMKAPELRKLEAVNLRKALIAFGKKE